MPVGDADLVLHIRLGLEETEPLAGQPHQVPLLLVLGGLGAGHLQTNNHIDTGLAKKITDS